MLRRILDDHPDVSCPAEADLGGMLELMTHTWRTLAAQLQVDGAHLEAEATSEIREAILRPMRWYCRRTGASVYCDKSLGTERLLPQVAEVLPEARFLFIFRWPMDVIMSLLEACPWGFRGYGLEQYVAGSVTNFVAALARYWVFHALPAVRWLQTSGARCAAVRYEDLVRRPDDVRREIWNLLEVPDPGARGVRFASGHHGPALGDHKIAYTDHIHDDSIGRGWRVPVEMIPEDLLAVMDELVETLGYEGSVSAALDAAAAAERVPQQDGPTAQLRLADRLARIDRAADVDSPAFELRLDDGSGAAWVAEPSAGHVQLGHGGGEFTLIGSADDLLALILGQENAGQLLRQRRVRYVGALAEGEEARHVRAAQRFLGQRVADQHSGAAR